MSGGGAKGLYHIGVLEAPRTVSIDWAGHPGWGRSLRHGDAAGYSCRDAATRQFGRVMRFLDGIDPNKYMDYYRQVGNNLVPEAC